MFGQGFSWRKIILIGGGLFLIYKGTSEIHEEIEGESEAEAAAKMAPNALAAIISQIIIIDLVFLVDSIVTAIGMADHVEVRFAAVIISVCVMFVASKSVADFIKRNPTTKMRALSFLMLIGISLVADGMGFHIPRGYICFAMAFSTLVEMINIAVRRRKTN